MCDVCDEMYFLGERAYVRAESDTQWEQDGKISYEIYPPLTWAEMRR